MPAAALTPNQRRLAVAIDVGHLERMHLRERFVDGVFDPCAAGATALLFKPVDSIAVALAVDHIHLAVVVHVVADDRKARVLHLPVAMPLPLILVGIDLLEPSVRRKNRSEER